MIRPTGSGQARCGILEYAFCLASIIPSLSSVGSFLREYPNPCRKQNGHLFQQGGHRGRALIDPIGQQWRKSPPRIFSFIYFSGVIGPRLLTNYCRP